MNFKSGLIHMTRNEILQDAPDGQRQVRIVVTDGSQKWVAWGKGLTQALAIENAYATALKRYSLPPDRLITVADVIQRLHMHRDRQIKLWNETGVMPVREYRTGGYKR